MSSGAPRPPRLDLRPAELRALRVRLKHLIREAGQTDLSPPDTEADPFWVLEPSPLILSAAEWQAISTGVIQRARLLNAFLRDVYSEQSLLEQRLVPPELILGNPHFRRPARHLEPQRAHPALLLRFDLIPAEGGWTLAGVSSNTPVGASYAVQNRRFLSQEAPQLYASLPDYHAIADFPLHLLESLRELSPRGPDQASIVVLTSGPHDPYYSEHSYLARKMGLPLATGDDLLVLDQRVYFKTIAGLVPVDVIYRRLGDAHIDPVVFSTSRQGAGVPGLLSCIRRQTVAVANAIGSGLAESRAIEAFIRPLCRFYLQEELILPGLPTYLCNDRDRVDALLAKGLEYRLRPTNPQAQVAGQLPEAEPLLKKSDELPPFAAADPFDFVLQQVVPRRRPRPGQPALRSLAVFVLAQNARWHVLPGGLVELDPAGRAPDRIGATTDAIALQANASPPPLHTPEAPPSSAPTPLGSRAAENLYWLGRYLERAEATARMISIFDDVALEEIPARDRKRWLPVWQGLLEATGNDTERLNARVSPARVLSPDLTWRIALDRGRPSSIFSSVESACENARQLRDCLSPEVWSLLRTLLDELTAAEAKLRDQPAPNPAEAVSAVLLRVNAVIGTAEKTLLQDSTWHFLGLGLHLERAIMTCSALRHTLSRGDLRDPAAGDNSDQGYPELSALVRMLGSQDAYRRLYRAGSAPSLVMDLFLQQGQAPRSIRHNIQKLADHVVAIAEEGGPIPPSDEPVRASLDSVLRALDELAKGPRAPAAQELGGLLGRLYDLHSVFSDFFFSHQARLPRFRAKTQDACNRD